MRILYVFAILWIPYTTTCQITLQSAKERSYTIFENDEPKPQVMLLGVFHFAGEKVDANTTPGALRVNMLLPERQQQIRSLVEKLAEFRPTKIAIEGDPRSAAAYDSLYRDYLNGKAFTGKYPDTTDELVQLSFRLAKLLKLEKVYPVNAQAFRFQLSTADSLTTYDKYKSQGDSSYTYWEDKYGREKSMQDSLAFFGSLQTYLQYLNSPEKQAGAIGRWLITTKRGTNEEPIGADGFITRYFNRNVRIYSNIQRIVTSKQDRILVIYGATHMYMLKQLFAASPEFSLKDIMPYLQ